MNNKLDENNLIIQIKNKLIDLKPYIACYLHGNTCTVLGKDVIRFWFVADEISGNDELYFNNKMEKISIKLVQMNFYELEQSS